MFYKVLNTVLKRSAITSTALINLYVSDILYRSPSFSSLLINNYVIQFGLIWNLEWRLLLSNFSLLIIFKSRHPEVWKKGVLRNFAKFTGKHLCQSLFFQQGCRYQPTNLLKRRLWHRYFSVNFAKFLWTPFLTEDLRWLLLNVVNTCSSARLIVNV